jgi:hypothetical protein
VGRLALPYCSRLFSRKNPTQRKGIEPCSGYSPSYLLFAISFLSPLQALGTNM